MKKNRLKQDQLRRNIERILWEDWDPIGVNDYDGPNDEYNGYVPSIFRLLIENADVQKITETLYHHANVNMGLSSKLEDHIPTAEKLHNLANGHPS